MHKASPGTWIQSAWRISLPVCALMVSSLFGVRTSGAQLPESQRKVGGKPARAEQQRSSSSPPASTHSADAIALPRPAEISFHHGLLAIQADNSDLNQIVLDVARASGMVVRGSAGNSRVYGLYGPRDPRDVLTELLSGAGLNILMVGRTELGAPREIVLTAKGPGPSPPVLAPVAVSPGALPPVMQDSGVTGTSGANGPGVLGPGAIPAGPPPPPDDPEERRQRNLHRLQQMQDRQKMPNAPR